MFLTLLDVYKSAMEYYQIKIRKSGIILWILLID
jgi:hypothetical protein